LIVIKGGLKAVAVSEGIDSKITVSTERLGEFVVGKSTAAGKRVIVDVLVLERGGRVWLLLLHKHHRSGTRRLILALALWLLLLLLLLRLLLLLLLALLLLMLLLLLLTKEHLRVDMIKRLLFDVDIG
jgi:hypothetical protein